MADKYLNLSGLQAFYNELTGKYNTAFTTADPAGKYPMQTSAIFGAISGVTLSAQSGASAWSAITANSAEWATDTNKIMLMADYDQFFDGYYAINAKSATSARDAEKAASATKANSAGKLSAARNIAASGDVTWSVSFDGSTAVTGAATVNSVPASAISSIPWSAVSALTGSGDQTNKLITPSAVDAKIAAAMTEKAAFKGPYETVSDIPAGDLDHLSIFLVGPTGTGTDLYKEYILPATGSTTADLLLIGDTSTDLADYMKTSAFTAYTADTGSLFSGTSRSATSAASAANASKLGGTAATAVTGSAAAGSAASAWITAHSGDYASSAHDHNYKISANTTAFDVSSNIRFSAGSNIALTSAGAGVIGISGAPIGNATITITTAASPSTSQTFTTNATAAKTISFGTMAFKASGDYMATGSMVPYTSAEVTGGISW